MNSEQLNVLSDSKAQSPKIKIQTFREGKTLILQCYENELFQARIEQDRPFLTLQIVKKVIKENKFEVISRTKNQIRIQVYTAIFQLQSEEALKMKKLQQNLEVLNKTNQLQLKQISQLKQKIKLLSQQQQKAKWEEENLDSTANFDPNCIYKLYFTNNYSLVSTAVCTSTLYFMCSGSNYTTSNTNRKANTTNWVVSKMSKLKVS